MIDLKQLMILAIRAAYEAGEEIVNVYYSSDFQISEKEDNSPLTLADKFSHNKIIEMLKSTDLPVLSEEGKSVPYYERKNWEYFWIVDPLDGTKEFIKKNDEFTVNIALIHKGKAILGVVYAPILKWMYYGNTEEGAYKVSDGGGAVKLFIPSDKKIETIVASRSHLNEETQQFIGNYPNAKVISMGSSLKFMLIAENKAQLYPRFTPTMEWDTAASQAIVESAGGRVLTYPEKEPMVYNKENMLNGWFIVQ